MSTKFWEKDFDQGYKIKMRVGFYQFYPIFGEKIKNLKKVSDRLMKIKADLIVLPELFATGYFFANRQELNQLAEPIPNGPTTQALLKIAQSKKMAIVAGVAEKTQGKIYNSSILVSPYGKVFIYRKVHLFRQEKFLFTPGNKPFPVFDIGGVKIGMLVCFDWIFPEATRILALGGAQIICQPANLILPYAHSATLTRALENRVFIILCNRIGEEKRHQERLKFNGMSQIVDPFGQIIYRAPKDREILKIVKIEPKQALNKKITELNDVISDRRPKLYRKLIR
ncbi:MAG: nitrilase-related carbon-nitrogen hydrolase [candidate division WOR-3 bacterium]